MPERMHKTGTEVLGCPQKAKTESDGMWERRPVYGWLKTMSWKYHLTESICLEAILLPENLNKAYKAVIRNKGCGGIDKMSCDELLPWLLANKESLIRSLLDGSYRPNPVLRVEIPKDSDKMRLLGIPTVVDRLVQQAINQVLTSIYEVQFSRNSFGFRPRRGCHDALLRAEWGMNVKNKNLRSI